jgi:hypothetical protein
MGLAAALHGYIIARFELKGVFFRRNRTPSQLNQAKPREKAPFVSGSERPESKIAPHGQTARPCTAHLLAESGHFRSAWFSRSNDGSSPKIVRPGKMPACYYKTLAFPLLVLDVDIAPERGLGQKF